MKRMKNKFILKALVPIFTFNCIIYSCSKENIASTSTSTKCTATKLPSLMKSIALNDIHSSAGNQPVVAIFKFMQDLESYEAAECKTLKPNCNISLNIQNTTAKRMLFDYTITYICGANTWQYQNYSTIEPNKVLDLSEISNNCGWITAGTISITSNNIIFE